MYAIIKTGGKQHRVQVDDVIDIELIQTEDNKVAFEDILFVSDGNDTLVGSPSVSNYFVHGEVVGIVKGPKVRSIKYHPSHNVRRKIGHRQHYSRVRITAIGKSKE